MQNPYILGNQPGYFNQLLSEMRDEQVQQDRPRFRYNLERAGELLAVELARLLPYTSREVTTPLGSCTMPVLKDFPVLVAILRAALPLHQGFLRIFDQSDSGFVTAYRHHTRGDEFEIRIEYSSAPDLTGRTLVLLDPMIATGKSLVAANKELERYGKPAQIYACGVIASDLGIEYVTRHLPQAQVLVGAVDEELTAKSYIIPGLGDAGDLAYGRKA